MAKLTTKIVLPVIFVGLFTMIALISVAINYGQLGIGFYIVVSLLVIFVFSSGIAMGQNLISPVKKILDKAEEISKGNLSSRVYLETEDEFSELAKTLNKIAEELQISHEQQTNMEKSVGIKVQARTKELEETVNALEQKVKNRTIELERLIEESKKLQETLKNKK